MPNLAMVGEGSEESTKFQDLVKTAAILFSISRTAAVYTEQGEIWHK